MTPEQVKLIVRDAIADGVTFPWWSYALSAAIGFCVAYFLPYITRRAQHLADKEAKPLTASEVLKAENYLNAKRDAYYEAIRILTRFSASVPWSGPDIPTDRDLEDARPYESEVNACIAKIAIFTDNPQIPSKYIEVFQNMSAPALGELIHLMRKDLGYGDLPLQPEDYRYHMRRNPSAESDQQAHGGQRLTCLEFE